MASSNYLDSPFGGADTRKFSFGGISELYLISKSKLGVLTTVKDFAGNDIEITGITPVSGATFQEIDFKEQNGSYTDVYKNGNNKFMTQTLNFIIDAAGSEAVEKAHQILLDNRMSALVKRNNGKTYLLGHDRGLTATDSKADSGAKDDDAATMEFTLSGANRGYAPEVTLDAAAFAAIVTRVA